MMMLHGDDRHEALCTWRKQTASCAVCELRGRLMCRFEWRDLLRFLFIVLPFFVTVIGGGDSPWLWLGNVDPAWLWPLFILCLGGACALQPLSHVGRAEPRAPLPCQPRCDQDLALSARPDEP